VQHFSDSQTDSESRKKMSVAPPAACIRQSSSPPFVRLPFELVRRVFELAANHSPTAYSLCLVSKDVHRWITPILFCSAWVVRNSGRYCEEGLLYIPNARLIKNLYLATPCSRSIHIEECTMLQYLYIDWKLLIPLLTREIPTLTHLTINYPNFGEGLPGKDALIFRSVTHLHFAHCRRHHRPKDLVLSPLPRPKLTHLVWGMIVYNAQDELRDFLNPLEPLDTLRVIGIYIELNLTSHDGRRLLQEMDNVVHACSFRDKHKVVIMLRRHEYIWEATERAQTLTKH
jgi:hypothetical protein